MLHGYFDIPTFHYFEEKNTWSGSNYTNFSYRIDPILGDEKELYVRVWYGTKCVTEVTDFVAEYHEEYSEKGLENFYFFVINTTRFPEYYKRQQKNPSPSALS